MLDISCKMSARQIIHMKCRLIYSENNRINFRMSPAQADFSHSLANMWSCCAVAEPI